MRDWDTGHKSRIFGYRSHECETDRQVKRVADLAKGHKSRRLGYRSTECETWKQVKRV